MAGMQHVCWCMRTDFIDIIKLYYNNSWIHKCVAIVSFSLSLALYFSLSGSVSCSLPSTPSYPFLSPPLSQSSLARSHPHPLSFQIFLPFSLSLLRALIRSFVRSPTFRPLSPSLFLSPSLCHFSLSLSHTCVLWVSFSCIFPLQSQTLTHTAKQYDTNRR